MVLTLYATNSDSCDRPDLSASALPGTGEGRLARRHAGRARILPASAGPGGQRAHRDRVKDGVGNNQRPRPAYRLGCADYRRLCGRGQVLALLSDTATHQAGRLDVT